MKKNKFSIAHADEQLVNLVKNSDKKILAIWAIECTERVMPFFENEYPEDNRPRIAINTLKQWIETGYFNMSVIRKASLDSHAAARETGEDTPARSAARAAGQAVATAHVKTHAYGPAIYGQQAIYRASIPSSAEFLANQERNWQYSRLCELIEQSNKIIN